MLGTQWCRGAMPTFNMRLARIIHLRGGLRIISVDNRKERRSRADLKAWMIKYLTADSVEDGVAFAIRSGTKEIRLNSNPVQAPNQE